MIWENLNEVLGRNKDVNFKDLLVNDKLTDHLDLIVNGFNRFFIDSVEELTTHTKCPELSYKPLENTK